MRRSAVTYYKILMIVFSVALILAVIIIFANDYRVSKKIESLEQQLSENDALLSEVVSGFDSLSKSVSLIRSDVLDEVEKVGTETKETLNQNSLEVRRLVDQARILAEKAEGDVVARSKESDLKLEDLRLQILESRDIDLAEVISYWRSRIALVECEFKYPGITFRKSGSGIAVRDTGASVAVLTNAHVVNDDNNFTAFSCRVRMSGSSNILGVLRSDIVISDDQAADWAYLKIGTPNKEIIDATSAAPKICSSRPAVGKGLVILGYPDIGSHDDLTATEGIVSGYDGNYFITSAKVDQGNSGGAAILLDDNCLLGIPTFVALGKVESLARVLDIKGVKY